VRGQGGLRPGSDPRVAPVLQQPLTVTLTPPAGVHTLDLPRVCPGGSSCHLPLPPAAAASTGKTQAPMYGEYTHFAPQQWISYTRLWPVAGSCVAPSLYYG
jgi:hypothetical protein